MRHLKLLLSLIIFISIKALPQEWDTFESKDFNIKFDVPADWTSAAYTESDIPYLESFSPDESMSLIVYAYKSMDISAVDLLRQAADDLGIALVGEANEKDINGLNAWITEATGILYEVNAGLFIMAATYEDNNYVAYVFSEESRFEKNADTMNKIINSFAPLN